MTNRTWLERVRDTVREVHPNAICTRKGDAFFVFASPVDEEHLGCGVLESLAWEDARQVMGIALN